MSGGVDSSVSAALLQKEGYDVMGVFIKVWQPDFSPCPWREERLDAMRVAAHLHIPFLTFDFEKEYKQHVVDYMIAEYTAGRTPNPDVMCNKSIKFGSFFEKATQLGADFVATGHYARTDGKNPARLLTGIDTNKDQSYFLWTLTQQKLPHILFPVGSYQKEEVRVLAQKFGLSTAQKKDSQGICFMGKLDIQEFLQHFVETSRGSVLDEQGTVIGKHDGALFYTIGERHGFTIDRQGTHETPRYVVRKDMKANTITVAQKANTPAERTKEDIIHLTETNWIAGMKPKSEKTYTARTRYRQKLFTCTLVEKNEAWSICATSPREAAAPGQSLVLYDQEECLGGGIVA